MASHETKLDLVMEVEKFNSDGYAQTKLLSSKAQEGEESS